MFLNRMTFSLASLIFLIALGLVFVPTSVMAHLADTTNAYVSEDHDGVPNNPGDDTTSETNHQHTAAPTVGAPELVNLMVGTDGSVRDTEVRLVDNAGTPTAFTDVVGDTTAAPNAVGQFQVKITFNGPVYADRTSTTTADGDLVAADLTVTAASKAALGTNLLGSGVSISAVARATDDATTTGVDESLNTFLVTFELAASLFGDQSADPVVASQLPIDVWITVNKDVLFTADGTLIDGTARQGRGNTASMRSMFTVVPMFDNQPPTVTISTAPPTTATGSFEVMYTTADADMDTVTASVALDAAATAAGYTVMDSTPGGTVTITQPTPDSATPTVDAMDVTLTITAMDDGTPPASAPATLTIPFAARMYSATAVTVAPGASVKSVMTGTGEIGPSATDVQLTLTSTAAGKPGISVTRNNLPLVEGSDYSLTAGTGMMWTLRVLVNDLTNSVKIMATEGFKLQQADPDDSTMMDDLAEGFTITVDRTGPTVDITNPTGLPAPGGPFSVTLTFSEPLAAMPVAANFTVTNGSISGFTLVSPGTYVATVTPDAGVAKTNTDATKQSVDIRLNAGVMDEHGNASMATAATDTADGSFMPEMATTAVDETAPTVTITAGTQTGRTLPITITAADETALASDAAIEGSEITVTGGTKPATITAANPLMIDVTIDYGVTTVTVAVAAGAVEDAAATPNSSAAATMDFTVTATSAPIGGTPTDAANILSGLTIPAKTHVVIARPGGMGLPANVTPVEWAGMPDLEALFFGGGTLSLTRNKAPKVDHDNDDPDGDGKKADGTTDASAPVDIGVRNLVITEVMAALNTAKPVGSDARKAHQWIEIYNKLEVEVSGVTLSTKAGPPDDVAAGVTDEVVVDRLSNVRGTDRWQFTGLGANGSYDGDDATTDTNFVSFYRNNSGEPGWQKSRWTTSSDVYMTGYIGTPGAAERTAVADLPNHPVNQNTALINEVANYPTADKDYEWLEILVTSDGPQRFKNWEVDIITGVDSVKRLFTLPEIPDAQKIGKDGILLVTNTDPANDPDHPLAVGYNVQKNDANQARGVPADHPVRYIVKAFDNELPDDGKFVLALRTRNDRDNHEGIVDLAGWHDNLKVNKAGFYTNLWPLGMHGAPASDKNDLVKGAVHYRQHKGVVGTGTTHGDKKDDQVAFRDATWTSVGYKRNARGLFSDAQLGGTPGYPNPGTNPNVGGAIVAEGDAATKPVIISEIMFDASNNLPQWIELQNMSNTVGINLDNWSLFVVNHNLDANEKPYDGKLSERIDLDGRIPPNQTFLIVSDSVRGNTTNLPDKRIWDLNRGSGEKLLNSNGFYLTLKAKTNEGDANKHQTVDTVGNLADPATLDSRRADAQSFADLAWTLPSGTTEDGDRVSISRKTTKSTNDQGHLLETIDLQKTGVSAWGWIRSDMDPRLNQLKETYYGRRTDISSPGLARGEALPVSLSKFRPERLDDGSIVIRWITESELNNAGFNILRSETRNGEFTKINTSLIAGQGTTSERTTYEWKDKSAKPNVVYYYQIQDVSLDGNVQTLRQSRLKGNVTAAGKLTTTWGELKSQD